MILCLQPVRSVTLQKFFRPQLRDRHNPHQRIRHKAFVAVSDVLRIQDCFRDLVRFKQIFPQDSRKQATGERGGQDVAATDQKEIRGGAFAELPFGVQKNPFV